MSGMFAIERSIRMPVVRLSHASDIYKYPFEWMSHRIVSSPWKGQHLLNLHM